MIIGRLRKQTRGLRETVKELSEKGPLRALQNGVRVALYALKSFVFQSENGMDSHLKEELDEDVYQEYVDGKTIQDLPDGAEYRPVRNAVLDSGNELRYQLWCGGVDRAGILVSVELGGYRTRYGTVDTDAEPPVIHLPEEPGTGDGRSVVCMGDSQYEYVQADFHSLVRERTVNAIKSLSHSAIEGSTIPVGDGADEIADGITLKGTPEIKLRPWKKGDCVYIAWEIEGDSGVFGTFHEKSIAFGEGRASGCILPEDAVKLLNSQVLGVRK